MKRFKIVVLLSLFTFGAAAYAQTATDIVTEAYEDVLGRKPDAEGMREFRSKVIENDWTAEDVRNALRKSDEYADKIIQQAFQDILGRKADKGALETYRARIRKGWTEKDLR
ncbi:MAG: DUF4214 domain-containing protein, partial [Kiritimatiellia bacterium]